MSPLPEKLGVEVWCSINHVSGEDGILGLLTSGSWDVESQLSGGEESAGSAGGGKLTKVRNIWLSAATYTDQA